MKWMRLYQEEIKMLEEKFSDYKNFYEEQIKSKDKEKIYGKYKLNYTKA